MENEPEKNANPAAAPSSAPQSEGEKKKSPWIWIIGGCLGVIFISFLIFIGLTWWGFNKVKKEINKRQPELQKFQQDLEQASKDAEEFNQKAQEIQKSIPNPEDISYPLPSSGEDPALN